MHVCMYVDTYYSNYGITYKHTVHKYLQTIHIHTHTIQYIHTYILFMHTYIDIYTTHTNTSNFLFASVGRISIGITTSSYVHTTVHFYYFIIKIFFILF